MRIMLKEGLAKTLRKALPEAGLFYLGLGTRCFLAEAGDRQYVLKERFDLAFRKERRTLEFLMAKGFPHVPVYHGVLRANGRRYLVSDYISGEDLHHRTLAPGQMRDLVQVLARFHALKTGAACPAVRCVRKSLDRAGHQKRILMAAVRINRSTTAVRCARYLDHLGQKIVFAVEEGAVAGRALVTPALLHSDLDFRRGENGRLYMIDMEDFTLGDPVWDLAGVCQAFTGVTDKAVLKSYAEHNYLDDESAARLRLYRLLLSFLDLISLVMELICISRGRIAVSGQKEQAFQRAFVEGVDRVSVLLTQVQEGNITRGHLPGLVTLREMSPFIVA